ncbi:hypothetical protein MBANPS3_011873 [Mucor bainieri]
MQSTEEQFDDGPDYTDDGPIIDQENSRQYFGNVDDDALQASTVFDNWNKKKDQLRELFLRSMKDGPQQVNQNAFKNDGVAMSIEKCNGNCSLTALKVALRTSSHTV